MPQDRTIKQPSHGFCRNPECREKGRRFEFEIQNDGFCCPKCGANRSPMVGSLVLTHWLAKDPTGPITGHGGIRYKMACDQDRAYLATVTNEEAATDNIQIVTCKGCLAAALEMDKQTAENANKNPRIDLLIGAER